MDYFKLYKNNDIIINNVCSGKKNPCWIFENGKQYNNKLFISEWKDKTKEEKKEMMNKIKHNDNYGTITGKQNKYIIGLDFDIYIKDIDNIDEETNNIFDDIIKNTKCPYFNSGTCHNKGILLNIDDEEIIKTIDENIKNGVLNTNKDKYKQIEILLNNPFCIPPFCSVCKQHNKICNKREFFIYDQANKKYTNNINCNSNILFNISNNDYFKNIFLKMLKNIADNKKNKVKYIYKPLQIQFNINNEYKEEIIKETKRRIITIINKYFDYNDKEKINYLLLNNNENKIINNKCIIEYDFISDDKFNYFIINKFYELLYCDDYTKENKLKDIELKIINNNYDKNEKYIKIEPITEKINNVINEIYNNKDNNDNNNNNNNNDDNDNEDNYKLYNKNIKDIITKLNTIIKYEFTKSQFFNNGNNNYDNFLIFSSLMKYYNLYDDFNKFNKSQKGYNEHNNKIIYDKCEPLDYINWFNDRYKKIEIEFIKQTLINKITTDKTINEKKLNYKMFVDKINFTKLKNKIIYDVEQLNNNNEFNNIYVKNERINTIKIKIINYLKKIIIKNSYDKFEIELKESDYIEFIKDKLRDDIDIKELNKIDILTENELYIIYYDTFIIKKYETLQLNKTKYKKEEIINIIEETKKYIFNKYKYNYIFDLLGDDMPQYAEYCKEYFTNEELNNIIKLLKIDNEQTNYNNLKNILNYIECKFKNIKDVINNNYIIKSDTGTGKTTTFINLSKNLNNFKFMSIVSRVSLANDHYNEMTTNNINVRHYNKNYGEAKFNNNNVSHITQLESLLKYKLDYSEYYIFIDEFNSLIEHMISSDTLDKNRQNIINCLYNILKMCKGFIFVDADISDISLKFIKFIRDDYIFIGNNFKHNNGVNANEIINEENFINMLKKEKKFIVCCDRLSSAKLLFKKLDGIKNNIKIITSETKDDDLNLNNHNKIIYSPKIIYGLDCVNFHNVYCYYHEDTINAKSMVQQVARTRNINKLYFIFLLKKFNKNNDITYDDLQKNISKRNNNAEQIINNNKEYENLNNLYLELYTDYNYNNYAYKSNMRGHFINILVSRGFNVIKDNTDNILIDKKKKQIIKDEIIDNDLENFIYDETNEQYKDRKQILHIPDGKEEDYKYFFINKYCFYNALAYNNLFKDDIELKNIIDKRKDFLINKIKDNKQKIRFLINLKKYENDKNILNVNHKDKDIFNNDEINKLNNFYNLINKSNIETTDKNINFNIPYERNKTHYEIINKIFHTIDGQKPFNKIREMKDGIRQYNYILNNNFFKPLKEIYNFMNADKNKLKKKIKTKTEQKNNINDEDLFMKKWKKTTKEKKEEILKKINNNEIDDIENINKNNIKNILKNIINYEQKKDIKI